ncbi:hypothetical protein [Desulfovibrio psychrotolerans]|uniref:Uncharacterized protein n=1 Tax=Desulfovibrio psychrotolerans TaxID=415242 RepID=A0A7J0BUY7_9BACT|nr:hypothetical protein [Desulfovibrio psychrotolerans]GFM37510.1 hypothetical protein DSM19430T_21940 [Desulfovibrio psychrotolerans]
MGLLDQPYTAFMLFMLLCFSGLMVMFFFMQRSIEELTKRMKDERNEVMEALRAMEKRLSQVSAFNRAGTTGNHVHFGRDGSVVYAENEGEDTPAAGSATSGMPTGAAAFTDEDPQADRDYFSAEDKSAYSEVAEVDDAVSASSAALPELDIPRPGTVGKGDSSRTGRGLQLADDDAVSQVRTPFRAKTPSALFEEPGNDVAYVAADAADAADGAAKRSAEDSAGKAFDMTELLQLSRQEEDSGNKRRADRRGKDKAAAQLTLDPFPAAVMTGITAGSDEPEAEVPVSDFRMMEADDTARASADDHVQSLFDALPDADASKDPYASQDAEERAGVDAEEVFFTVSARAGISADMQAEIAADGPDFSSDFMPEVLPSAMPEYGPEGIVPEGVGPKDLGLQDFGPQDVKPDVDDDDEDIGRLFAAFAMESDEQAQTAVAEGGNVPAGPELVPVSGRGTAQVLSDAQADDASAYDASAYDTSMYDADASHDTSHHASYDTSGDDDEEVILLTPEEIVTDEEDAPAVTGHRSVGSDDYFGKGGGRLFSFFDEDEEESARPVQTAGDEDYAPADRSVIAADALADEEEPAVFSSPGVFSGTAEAPEQGSAEIPADDGDDAPIDMDSALAKALAAAGITDDAPPADGSRYLSDVSVGQEAGNGESMDFVWEDDTVPGNSEPAQRAGDGKKKRDRGAGEASDNITEYIVPE